MSRPPKVGLSLVLRSDPTPAGMCRIEGCASKAAARGLCARHHANALDAGRLEELGLPVKNPELAAIARKPRRRPVEPSQAEEPQHPAESDAAQQAPAVGAEAPVEQGIFAGDCDDTRRPESGTCASRSVACAVAGPNGTCGGHLPKVDCEGQEERSVQPGSMDELVRDLRTSLRSAEEELSRFRALADSADPWPFDRSVFEDIAALASVAAQRDALLAERRRICEALGVDREHPEPAGVASRLGEYERILEICDTPIPYQTGVPQLQHIVGQWRQLGDPTGAHYRAYLASGYIRDAILGSGHPLGDDSDPELTPLRLVRELLEELAHARAQWSQLTLDHEKLSSQRDAILAALHAPEGALPIQWAEDVWRERMAYQEEKGLLLEERVRICRALGIDTEHPEPAERARLMKSDLDAERETDIVLSEMAHTIGAVDGEGYLDCAIRIRRELDAARQDLSDLRRIPSLDRADLERRCTAWTRMKELEEWPGTSLLDEPDALRDEATAALTAYYRGVVYAGLDEAPPTASTYPCNDAPPPIVNDAPAPRVTHSSHHWEDGFCAFCGQSVGSDAALVICEEAPF